MIVTRARLFITRARLFITRVDRALRYWTILGYSWRLSWAKAGWSS